MKKQRKMVTATALREVNKNDEAECSEVKICGKWKTLRIQKVNDVEILGWSTESAIYILLQVPFNTYRSITSVENCFLHLQFLI